MHHLFARSLLAFASMLCACTDDEHCQSTGAIRIYGVCECPDGSVLDPRKSACTSETNADASTSDAKRSSEPDARARSGKR